ncbi:MAG: type II toxin-antitoxin system RelE/ParE family toxin [bacterium]|nr:type II toxin-antitoxin system RelE/ParE family toxin [bacterium]
MPSYKITFKPSVHKDLRKLPKNIVGQVFAQIEDLRLNPLPSNSIKLEGAERIYRIRIGDYRLIYQVDNSAKEITVHYIRHRSEVYKK